MSVPCTNLNCLFEMNGTCANRRNTAAPRKHLPCKFFTRADVYATNTVMDQEVIFGRLSVKVAPKKPEAQLKSAPVLS